MEPIPDEDNKKNTDGGNGILTEWCKYDQDNDLLMNPREFFHMVSSWISKKRRDVTGGASEIHDVLE
jgi:hypothetical protein